MARILAEIVVYRSRLAQLRYRADSGERIGLQEEAGAYANDLAALSAESPPWLGPEIAALADEFHALLDKAAK